MLNSALFHGKNDFLHSFYLKELFFNHFIFISGSGKPNPSAAGKNRIYKRKNISIL